MKASGVDTGDLDDGSKLVDITSVFGAGGLDFYGTTYTGIYINTNGIITLDSPQLGYAPVGISGLSDPAIAPLWVDIDISSGGDIYWDSDPVAGTVTITWDTVRAYNDPGTNSFQVVLTDNGGGDFSIEFIYESVLFAADSGNVATAGITDGGTNDFALEGSGNESFMRGYETNDFDNGDPPGVFSLNVTGGTVPCFTEGTQIETTRGLLAVEDITTGDWLPTLDHGLQPVLWVSKRAVSVAALQAQQKHRPVVIRKGALGNARRMLVSQQHAFLVQDRLVRAKHLADFCGGKVARYAKPTQSVVYYHLLTPSHGLIRAEGAWTETLFPGDIALPGLTASDQLSLLAALPEVDVSTGNVGRYGAPARPYATRRDIRRGEVRLVHGVYPDLFASDLLTLSADPRAELQHRHRAARHQRH